MDDEKKKSFSALNWEGTHITQVHHNLPHSRLVQARKRASILPQEPREITELAQFCAYEQRVVLLPTIHIRQYVRMSASRRQMRQYVHFFPQAQPVKNRLSD
jgi:hypothetical protein